MNWPFEFEFYLILYSMKTCIIRGIKYSIGNMKESILTHTRSFAILDMGSTLFCVKTWNHSNFKVSVLTVLGELRCMTPKCFCPVLGNLSMPIVLVNFLHWRAINSWFWHKSGVEIWVGMIILSKPNRFSWTDRLSLNFTWFYTEWKHVW